MLLFCVVAPSAQTNISKGTSPYGNVLYNWDGKNLRQGSSAYGPVIANWDGENIRQGSSPYDKLIYNWDGNSHYYTAQILRHLTGVSILRYDGTLENAEGVLRRSNP